jgi:hypothetical protein
VFLTVICLIPRIPDRLMEAYTRISLPVNKLNVSSPEGDDNNYKRIDSFEFQCCNHTNLHNFIRCIKISFFDKLQSMLLLSLQDHFSKKHFNDHVTMIDISYLGARLIVNIILGNSVFKAPD